MTDCEFQKTIECAEFLGSVVARRLVELFFGQAVPKPTPSAPEPTPCVIKEEDNRDHGIVTMRDVAILLNLDESTQYRTIRKRVESGYFPSPIDEESHRKEWLAYDIQRWQAWKAKSKSREHFLDWLETSDETFPE